MNSVCVLIGALVETPVMQVRRETCSYVVWRCVCRLRALVVSILRRHLYTALGSLAALFTNSSSARDDRLACTHLSLLWARLVLSGSGNRWLTYPLTGVFASQELSR